MISTFFLSKFLAQNMGSLMTVRLLMVPFKVHGKAFNTLHAPTVRRDPKNMPKIGYKSGILIVFHKLCFFKANGLFLNDR